MEKAAGITTPRYIHLVLTRFNLQYEEQDTMGIQPEWLEKRCTLFEQYCLLSLQAQTCQDFIWILVMDERTPEPYRSRIKSYAQQMSQIRVISVSYRPDTEGYFHDLGQQYGGNNIVLITSRIDNDDRFAPDYIARVQALAKEGRRGIISFPEGRQTFVKSGKSYRVRFVDNHFLSRIETDGFYTALGFQHREATRLGVLAVPTAEPMWEEMVHSSNMLNDYNPEYDYHITGLGEMADLTCRWIRFQYMRAGRLLKRLFVASDKK